MSFNFYANWNISWWVQSEHKFCYFVLDLYCNSNQNAIQLIKIKLKLKLNSSIIFSSQNVLIFTKFYFLHALISSSHGMLPLCVCVLCRLLGNMR